MELHFYFAKFKSTISCMIIGITLTIITQTIKISIFDSLFSVLPPATNTKYGDKIGRGKRQTWAQHPGALQQLFI